MKPREPITSDHLIRQLTRDKAMLQHHVEVLRAEKLILEKQLKKYKSVGDYSGKVNKRASRLLSFAVWAYNYYNDRPTKDAVMAMRKLKNLKITDDILEQK